MTQIEIVPGWQLYIFSCAGTLLLWTKLTDDGKRIHGFGDVLDYVFTENVKARFLSQFIIFVIFGGFIGLLAVGPYTQLQALAGGIAWSRLMAKD